MITHNPKIMKQTMALCGNSIILVANHIDYYNMKPAKKQDVYICNIEKF